VECVKNNDDIQRLKNNRIIGDIVLGHNAEIVFEGFNNVFAVKLGCKLLVENVKIKFFGDNGVAFIANNHLRNAQVCIYHSSWFYYGYNGFLNGSCQDGTQVFVDEGKGIFIGDNHRFSERIQIRTSDMHPFYDITSRKRLNGAQSVFIGDGVWLGHGCTILKNTRIGSGAIIGTQAVVASKTIPSNTIWAGNPAKQVRENVTWGDAGAKFFSSMFDQERSAQAEILPASVDMRSYTKDQSTISTAQFESEIALRQTAMERVDFLTVVSEKKTQNRFFIAQEVDI
jgi:acetyltransferase-like isoleucine patch superfamily enzyme